MASAGTKPWNAGTSRGWTDKRGYRWIRIGGKSYREHRVIMSRYLGRTLRGDEIVHHLNSDTTDNRIENLIIMAPASHTRGHHNGAKRSDMAKARMARADRDRERIRALRRCLSDVLDWMESYEQAGGNELPERLRQRARALLARIEGAA